MGLNDYNINKKEEAKIRRVNYNNNPNICKYCGKPIYLRENENYKDVIRKKFCSRSCASKYGHQKTDKNKIIINKPTKLENNFSDKELIQFYYESKSIKELEEKIGYTNICSQPRIIEKYLYLGLNIFELKNKNVDITKLSKEELFNRNAGYQNARSQIQRHARITYNTSKKPKQCIVCGYNKHYEVAHIKPVSGFSDDSLIQEINNINNLIALCPNHHWEFDNGLLDLSVATKD